MTDVATRLADAEAARAAWERFVGPAIDTLKAEYLTKLADLAARPMTDQVRAGMEKLAVGIKVAGEVETQLRALISDAAVARDDVSRASRLANMDPERRRWISFAPSPI